jgi:hypothetical protein
MEREKVDRFSGLSALQIALLAMAASTVAAVGTLLGLRRFGIVRKPSGANEVAVPAVPTRTGTSFPNHFSEEIVVPGITYTGAEVQKQDEREGRSPEGV